MLPFATIAQLGLGGLMLACLATWWQLLRQQKRHQSPIPMEPRPAVPWGLCHLLAALFLLEP